MLGEGSTLPTPVSRPKSESKNCAYMVRRQLVWGGPCLYFLTSYLLSLYFSFIVARSIAGALVAVVQLIASIAVTAITAGRVVADVVTTTIVFLTFIHVCRTKQRHIINTTTTSSNNNNNLSPMYTQ